MFQHCWGGRLEHHPEITTHHINASIDDVFVQPLDARNRSSPICWGAPQNPSYSQ